jgi:hypothetical protein
LIRRRFHSGGNLDNAIVDCLSNDYPAEAAPGDFQLRQLADMEEGSNSPASNHI